MFVIQRAGRGISPVDEFISNVSIMEGTYSLQRAQRFSSITAIFNAVSSRAWHETQLKDEYHIVEVSELPPGAPTIEIVGVL